jgi:hypothetical protein
MSKKKNSTKLENGENMINRKIKRSTKPGDIVRPEIFRRTHKKGFKNCKG